MRSNAWVQAVKLESQRALWVIRMAHILARLRRMLRHVTADARKRVASQVDLCVTVVSQLPNMVTG